MNNNMIPTGNKSKYGQPLYECIECKEQGENFEHTVTYTLFKSELCWECYQEFKA
tara:strand:- start:137 stop:301 length:165 start_codon:yes stop_codon:yes gene_type:complete